jgi:ABC-type branched-subunit amino acid transport system permease subunit
MNPRLARFAIPGLRWVLGLVVLEESLRFALSSSAARHLAHFGLPAWMQPALGISEAVAALLFLLPAVRLAGGYLLLGIFTLATVIHVLHGEYDVGPLLVYAMGVLVCMSDGSRR